MLQNRDVIKMAVVVQYQGIYLKQQRQVLREIMQTRYFRGLLCNIAYPCLIARELLFHTLPHFPFQQMGKRDYRLTFFQKIRTGAAYPLPTVRNNTADVVPHEFKRCVLFNIALAQKLRNQRFRKRFVTELIQLVPDAVVKPFLLVSL